MKNNEAPAPTRSDMVRPQQRGPRLRIVAVAHPASLPLHRRSTSHSGSPDGAGATRPEVPAVKTRDRVVDEHRAARRVPVHRRPLVSGRSVRHPRSPDDQHVPKGQNAVAAKQCSSAAALEVGELPPNRKRNLPWVPVSTGTWRKGPVASSVKQAKQRRLVEGAPNRHQSKQSARKPVRLSTRARPGRAAAAASGIEPSRWSSTPACARRQPIAAARAWNRTRPPSLWWRARVSRSQRRSPAGLGVLRRPPARPTATRCRLPGGKPFPRLQAAW